MTGRVDLRNSFIPTRHAAKSSSLATSCFVKFAINFARGGTKPSALSKITFVICACRKAKVSRYDRIHASRSSNELSSTRWSTICSTKLRIRCDHSSDSIPDGAQNLGGDFSSFRTSSRTDSAWSRLAEFFNPLVFQRKSFLTMSVMAGEPSASKIVRNPVMDVRNLSIAMSPLWKHQLRASLSSAACWNALLMSEKGCVIASDATVTTVVVVVTLSSDLGCVVNVTVDMAERKILRTHVQTNRQRCLVLMTADVMWWILFWRCRIETMMLYRNFHAKFFKKLVVLSRQPSKRIIRMTSHHLGDSLSIELVELVELKRLRLEFQNFICTTSNLFQNSLTCSLANWF